MVQRVVIDGRPIGDDQPPYIIAELSGNHRGDLGRALALIDAAKDAGADAVKLQTYTADTITIDHDGPAFRIASGSWAGRRLYDLYREAHTPWHWHEALFAHARALGIAIFSSPFDPAAVDFLASLAAPAYKIASFELTDLPLISCAAGVGKPLILSTGMASDAEIAEAAGAARRAGCRDLALLHCVSGYPTPAEEADLSRIRWLAERFSTIVGLSDHTLGSHVAVAAVALGARVIEKHVTLRRADGGPDAAFSLEPDELARLCRDCRSVWQALRPQPRQKPSEAASLDLRRSLFVVADVAAGEPFTPVNIRSIRPGHGLAPKHLPAILQRVAARPLARGTPLTWEMTTPAAEVAGAAG
jgi:N-acetylneuraminate synthase